MEVCVYELSDTYVRLCCVYTSVGVGVSLNATIEAAKRRRNTRSGASCVCHLLQ